MSRLFLTLAVLSFTIQLVSATSSSYYCPKVSNPTQYAACNSFGETVDCFDRCCKSTGVCFSSACDSTFGVSDANANCAGSCLNEVQCVPYKSSCTSTAGQPHCLGFTKCKTKACGGRQANQVCLYDGKSANFKVCCVDGGGVVGDPQFVGLRGQEYQVHGVSGLIYNIISDSDLQYNSRFVFLNSGDCPIIKGRRASGCFSHPGSYLGELGLKSRNGERIHVKTGSAARGFEEVSVDGVPLVVGQTIFLAEDEGSVTLNSTHVSEMIIGNWQLVFENSDHYLNQRVSVLDSQELKTAHGMLGQTWRDKTYKNPIKYIEGAVDDYVIQDKTDPIYGDDFMYNQYN